MIQFTSIFSQHLRNLDSQTSKNSRCSHYSIQQDFTLRATQCVKPRQGCCISIAVCHKAREGGKKKKKRGRGRRTAKAGMGCGLVFCKKKKRPGEGR